MFGKKVKTPNTQLSRRRDRMNNFLKDGRTDNMGYWTEALKLVKQGSEIAVDLSKVYANLQPKATPGRRGRK